ncbi:MAG: PAS domain S-box protein [Candidatus Aenigmarchaeota archaeon]|nr:PAS domain S-box protein [Candidatus Aenigmarchaeota archaeon]
MNPIEIKENIISLLKTRKDGLSSSEIQRQLKINRTTVMKYLHILQTEGQIIFKNKGMAKVWSVSESPILAFFSVDSNIYDEKNYLKELFNTLQGTGIIMLDKEGKILWINETLSSWVGDIKDVLEKQCYSIYQKDNKKTNICVACETMKTGRPSTTEKKILSRFRGIMTVEVCSFAIRNKKGTVLGVLQILRDLTEQKKLEEKATEYTDRLEKRVDERTRRLVLLSAVSYNASQPFKLTEFLNDVLKDIMYVLHVSSGMIFIADAVRKKNNLVAFQGISKEFQESCIKKPLDFGAGLIGAIAESGELIHTGDNFSGHPKIILPEAKKEGLRSFVGVPLRAKGAVRGVMVLASKSAHKFNSNDLDVLIALANQIGIAIENAELFKKIKESKTYLESIIEMSSDGIFVVDVAGNLEFGNPVCTEISGWKKEELIGKPFMSIIPKDYHAFMLARWQEAQKGDARPYETEIITKSGARKRLSVSHRAVEFNRQRKYINIIRDLTNQENIAKKKKA